MNMEQWWNYSGKGETELLGEKPIIMPRADPGFVRPEA
jgi:hypothetical protein